MYSHIQGKNYNKIRYNQNIEKDLERTIWRDIQKTITINYRRADSADEADRIYDSLVQKFGRDGVFKDVDTIPFGVDFREYLNEAVSKCSVLLAVIGKDWLTISDEAGNRRLDDPADFVRIEIEAALARGIPVVPILVQGASMPKADDLPSTLEGLAYRNGLPVRHDPDYHRDIDRLIRGIEATFDAIGSKEATNAEIDRAERLAADQAQGGGIEATFDAKEPRKASNAKMDSAERIATEQAKAERVVTNTTASAVVERPERRDVSQENDLENDEISRKTRKQIILIVTLDWFVYGVIYGFRYIINYQPILAVAVGGLVGALIVGISLKRLVSHIRWENVVIPIIGWIFGGAISWVVFLGYQIYLAVGGYMGCYWRCTRGLDHQLHFE